MNNIIRGAWACARGVFFAGLSGSVAVVFFAFYLSANSSGQPVLAGNPAAAAVPLRVLVKFRPGLDQSLARTCSVDVTPAGGSELTVGLNDAFRATPTSLDTWNLEVNSTPSGCSLMANNLNP
jgi:hypothetical protein